MVSHSRSQGITDGFGHVSYAFPEPKLFLPSRSKPGRATRSARHARLRRSLSRRRKSPPYEWPIHACIMRARADVMSVCTPLEVELAFSVLKAAFALFTCTRNFFLPKARPSTRQPVSSALSNAAQRWQQH